jgi:hypothetical protein
MRLIIEARLEGAQTGATAAEATIVDVVETVFGKVEVPSIARAIVDQKGKAERSGL